MPGRPRDNKNEGKAVAFKRGAIIEKMESLGLPPEVVAAFRSLTPRDVKKVATQFQSFLKTYGSILDNLFGDVVLRKGFKP